MYGLESQHINIDFFSNSNIMSIVRAFKVINVIYTIEQIKERITPVAIQYRLSAVYLFGSYAVGEANDESDIDILVDKTGSGLKGMFAMGGLYNDLREAVGKSIDLVTTDALNQESTRERTPWFVKNTNKTKIKIYG